MADTKCNSVNKYNNDNVSGCVSVCLSVSIYIYIYIYVCVCV